jgi:hypothetical protein
VWKSGFEATPQGDIAVAIAGDVSLRVEMERLAQDTTVWGLAGIAPLSVSSNAIVAECVGGGRPLR